MLRKNPTIMMRDELHSTYICARFGSEPVSRQFGFATRLVQYIVLYDTGSNAEKRVRCGLGHIGCIQKFAEWHFYTFSANQ